MLGTPTEMTPNPARKRRRSIMLPALPGKFCAGSAASARWPWLRQRRFHVFEALCEFLSGSAVTGVFIFDVRGNGIALRLEEAQYRFDGRVALTERQIGTVVLLSVLEVQIGDPAMVRTDEGH